MKKKFNVSVDVTYSVEVCVEAENEEQAKQEAKERIGKEPVFWIRQGAIAGIHPYEVEEEL